MVEVNPNVFRTYDIRGLVDSDLTPEVLDLVGKAFGTWILAKGGRTVVVGRDVRLSSEVFHHSVISGLLSTGCDVLDIGLSTTPLMNFTVIDRALDGGINITGSHNPIEYNGIKLTGPKGYTVTEQDIQDILGLVQSGTFQAGFGNLQAVNPKTRYFDKIKELCKPQRKLKVTVDCGNGVVGAFAPDLIRELGHDVTDLYCELDGNFPNHLPDPEREDSLRDLRALVRSGHSDVGVAFDGDGDRLGLVDETGLSIPADLTIILLSRDLLTRLPGAEVLVDIKCSQNVLDDISEHGGVPVLYKTGYSLIRQKMRADQIPFGGEQSGHMFFGEGYPYLDDGLLAACLTLRILSEDDSPLSSHFQGLPQRYTTPLILIPMPDELKLETVERIKSAIKSLSISGNINEIDGIRATFPNGWALVRASNTSPNLTVRIEADNKAILEDYEEIVFQILSDNSPVSVTDWREHN